MGGFSRIIHVTIPDAEDIYFDDSNIDIEADDVQEIIEKIVQAVVVSASPGFTWGDRGVLSSGSYLLNDNVPSNISGRLVTLENAAITDIFITMKSSANVDFDIRVRGPGNSFSTLYTFNTNGARATVLNVNVPVNYEDELAIRVSPNSTDKPSNPDIGLIIKGNRVT